MIAHQHSERQARCRQLVEQLARDDWEKMHSDPIFVARRVFASRQAALSDLPACRGPGARGRSVVGKILRDLVPHTNLPFPKFPESDPVWIEQDGWQTPSFQSTTTLPMCVKG